MRLGRAYRDPVRDIARWKMEGETPRTAKNSDANLSEKGSMGTVHIASKAQQQSLTQRSAMHMASIKGFVEEAEQMSAADWDTFSRYGELEGTASSLYELTAPFSGKKAACYQAEVYALGPDGTEILVLRENKLDVLTISDNKGNAVIAVDAQTFGGKLMLDPVFDEIMLADALPSHIKNLLKDDDQKTLRYHVVERAISHGAPLYILGEIYLRNGIVHVRSAYESARASLVTHRTQGLPKKKQSSQRVVSAIFAIVAISFGIFMLLSSIK